MIFRSGDWPSRGRFASGLAGFSLLSIVACGGGRTASYERDSTGRSGDDSATEQARAVSAPAGAAVLVGAGDVASCGENRAALTAQLLERIEGTVFVAGDGAYQSRKHPSPYLTCYAKTWGKFKDRTRPVLGNHDSGRHGITRYFEYFGTAAGDSPGGYYSYEAGEWHVVALNTNIDMSQGSPQEKWLRQDLEKSKAKCTIAIMHHPRFSSGPHGGRDKIGSLWKTLQDHGAEIAVSGHDHLYERFAPMMPDGSRSASGIRQFVVGTGGKDLYGLRTIASGSEAREDGAYGVLKFTLSSDRYRWQFVPVPGNDFRDAGEGVCH